MPRPVTNPYTSDEHDQDHCAVCGESITQPRRGPARIYCARSECRRGGALRHKLAVAWDEGYSAGHGGRALAPAPPPADKRHWATAFAAGAEAAKRHARHGLRDLETAVDTYVREPTREHRAGVQRARATMRESLRLSAPTKMPPP